MNRDFKGIWIPREIWLHPELLPLEKLLWAEIHSLYNREKGGCYATNEYLAEFFKVSERYIREMVSKLKGLDVVKEVAFDGRQRVIMAVLPPEDLSEFRAERNYSSGVGGTTVPVSQEPQFRGVTPCPYNTYNKDDNKDKNIARSSGKCAQTASPPRAAKAADIFYSFDKNKFENITQEDIKTWQQLYPNTDIQMALLQMTEWIKANPTKAKAKKLWRKFITGWLQKSNEKSMNRLAYQSMNAQQVISRHTGFQNDHSPRNPKKVIDLRYET